MPRPDRPLEGTTVIDCSTVYAGPMAAQVLGDFGAEVIKVEHPEFGDAIRGHGQHPEPLAYKWLNRNKRSVGIDLHEEAGQAVAAGLAAGADVLVENFRPGTLERWNLGPDRLHELNEDLVVVRVTGFGQTGPYRDRPGFGSLAEGMSGFAAVTGQPDGPPTLPSLGLADFSCALGAAFATMLALYWRDVAGGSGQVIDMSLLEPLFSFMGAHAVEYTYHGVVHERQGNRTHSSSPRNTYRTKDGEWVVVVGATEATARRVMRVVGGEDVLDDPRFATMEARIEHDEAVDDLVGRWVADRTRDEVIEELVGHDVPVGPVYDIAGIVDDPQIRHRETMAAVWDDELGAELEMPGVIPKLSATPGRIESTGPPLGADTRAVLRERTALSDDEIDALADDGVLAVAD